MPFPVLVPAAEADIDEALLNTLAKWGERKLEEYAELIEEDPTIGPTTSGRFTGTGPRVAA